MTADRHPNADLLQSIHDFATAAREESLDPDQARQFEQLLRDNLDARQLYVEYTEATMLMPRALGSAETNGSDQEFGDGTQEPGSEGEAPVEPPARSRTATRSRSFTSRHRVSTGIAVAIVGIAALLVVLAITPVSQFLADNEPNHRRNLGPVDSAEEIATLTGWHRIDWKEGYHLSGQEHRLRAGQKVAMNSGLAEITYDTGAKVVLEGPCEFIIGGQASGNQASGTSSARSSSPHPSSLTPHPSSSNSGYLSLGSLVARCDTPDSQGFTIATPHAEIEDLGTEFGVQVLSDGPTNIEVFEGSVEVDNGSQRRKLVESESATVDRSSIRPVSSSRVALKTWTRRIAGQPRRHELPKPGGRLVWEGGAGNGDLFDERNWNLDGRGHPPAGTIEDEQVIGHDAVVRSDTIKVKQSRRILLGSGRTWTFTDAVVEGDSNTSYHPRDLNQGGSAAIDLRGVTAFTFGWSWDIQWTLHDHSQLTARNANATGTGVLGKTGTLNLASPDTVFKLTDIAPEDALQLASSVYVNGKPAVLGDDPAVAEPDDNLLVEPNGERGTIMVPLESAFIEQ